MGSFILLPDWKLGWSGMIVKGNEAAGRTGRAALRLLLNHQGHGNQRLSAESRYAGVAADGNPPPTFYAAGVRTLAAQLSGR
jgi:hypothetical protein